MKIRTFKGTIMYNYDWYKETDNTDDYVKLGSPEEFEAYGFDDELQAYLIDGVIWEDMAMDTVTVFIYADECEEIVIGGENDV